jgi:hypothetical protein
MKKIFHPTKTMQRALAKVKHRRKLSVGKFQVIYKCGSLFVISHQVNKYYNV